MRALRIGLGCTLLERAMNSGRLDGIGVYTQNLREALARSTDAHILPACFPPKPWQPALAHSYPGKFSFGMAYGLSSAMSRATALPFPGASRLARQIDVYHAPDWCPLVVSFDSYLVVFCQKSYITNIVICHMRECTAP